MREPHVGLGGFVPLVFQTEGERGTRMLAFSPRRQMSRCDSRKESSEYEDRRRTSFPEPYRDPMSK